MGTSTSPVGAVAVLAAVLLVVVASTAGGTAARFGDDERVNATFSTEPIGDPAVATLRSAADEPSLTVSLQNGRSADRWVEGVSYGPPDYRTGVLVITGDDLKLETTSDATEPLTFEIEADLIARALDVDDLGGVTATLDGRPLDYEVQYVGGADHAVFTVDRFSTRYVVFAATEAVGTPAEPTTDAPTTTDAAPTTTDAPPKKPAGPPGRPPAPPGLPGDGPLNANGGPDTPTDTETPESTDTETPEPTDTLEPTPTPTTTATQTPTTTATGS